MNILFEHHFNIIEFKVLQFSIFDESMGVMKYIPYNKPNKDGNEFSVLVMFYDEIIEKLPVEDQKDTEKMIQETFQKIHMQLFENSIDIH